MADLPRISMIVPNVNGAGTLGETLDSLREQRYANLEVIAVDGGSTDGSAEILRARQGELAWWVSETDRGQSHAINKGIERATGEVLGWINSDDVLLPGALSRVGAHFRDNPACDVLSGVTVVRRLGPGGGTRLWAPKPSHLRVAVCRAALPQQSTFFHKRVVRRTPLIDESLHYTMDVELWCYLLSQGARVEMIEEQLAEFREHPAAKTSTGGEKIVAELEGIYRRYCPGERVPLTVWSRRLRMPLQRWILGLPAPLARLARRGLDAPLVFTLGLFYGRERVRAMEWAAFVGPSQRR